MGRKCKTLTKAALIYVDRLLYWSNFKTTLGQRFCVLVAPVRLFYHLNQGDKKIVH